MFEDGEDSGADGFPGTGGDARFVVRGAALSA
jgi:hypothetical protein